MVTYHLNFPHPELPTQWCNITLAPGTSRREAVLALKALPKGTKLLWTCDSAAELRRQTAMGRAWAIRMWHPDHIPRGSARTRALREWSRLCLR